MIATCTDGAAWWAVAPVPPPGIGGCDRCDYRQDASAAMCWECAAAAIRRPMHGERCGVCDHPLPVGRACPNYWCGREDRGFDTVWAVGGHAGALRATVASFKYRGGRGWGSVLGRIVAGFLNDHAPWFEEFDLITASPGHRASGGSSDSTGVLLDAVRSYAGDLWPIDHGQLAIAKRWATQPVSRAESGSMRRRWAACELRPSLWVPDPRRVAGRAVLVLDDVFTDGSTLREVAFALRHAGARRVSGLVLARRLWRGRDRGRVVPCSIRGRLVPSTACERGAGAALPGHLAVWPPAVAGVAPVVEDDPPVRKRPPVLEPGQEGPSMYDHSDPNRVR